MMTSGTRVTVPLLAMALATIAIHTDKSTASTRSYGGNVQNVSAIDDSVFKQHSREQSHSLRRFTTKSWYLHYVSGEHRVIGEQYQQQVRSLGTACMLNGELINTYTFAKALRPEMWGHVYEDQWFDFYTLPKFEWGEVISHDASDRTFRLRKHQTMNPFHRHRNQPVEETVQYAKADFELEGKPVNAEKALAKGNWVQVHPPREQLVSVHTKESDFDPDHLMPYWKGRRGRVNDLTAPGRLRGYLIHQPDEAYSPHTQLEITRLSRGQIENITFRGSPALFLDGRAAPPKVALRPGRRLVAVHYRSHQSPHYVHLWSDTDSIRGRIDALDLDRNRIEVMLIDELTGEPTGQTTTISLDADARYELNGQASTAADSLSKGRRVTIFPKRGRTMRAFEPRPEDTPDFTIGDVVTGRVFGHREHSVELLIKKHGAGPRPRMRRFDLNLGTPLQGPTRVSHRRLVLTVTTRDSKLESIVVNNFAFHGAPGSGSPAWSADIVNKNIHYAEGRLRGKITLDIDPKPDGQPASPVRGGRYHFDIDTQVRANHVAGTARVTLDGRNIGNQDVTGRAELLPTLGKATVMDAVYVMVMSDPQQRVKPISVRIEFSEGKVKDAFATVDDHQRYSLDTSDLKLTGDRLVGKLRCTMPAQQVGLQGSVDLSVALEVDVEQVGSHLYGTFQCIWSESTSQK